jgi:hypothetical protein
VSIVAIVLLACAVLVLVGAEWPRLGDKVGRGAIERRSRRRRKEKLTVIRGEEAGDVDDFAASVQRDLENLPVLGEERDRS